MDICVKNLCELAAKCGTNGKRSVKLVLHELHEAGEWNENGISWIRELVEPNLASAAGCSITCAFTDGERTELSGHGVTENRDGLPVFGDATMVGCIQKAYVAELNGKPVVMADGWLDELRYGSLVDTLRAKLDAGEGVAGSVEIIGKPENDNAILYRGGWRELGREPESFLYSGFALLGVRPADPTASLIELNDAESAAHWRREAKSAQLRLALMRYSGDEPELARTEIEAFFADPDASAYSVEQLMDLIDARAYRRMRRGGAAAFPVEEIKEAPRKLF